MLTLSLVAVVLGLLRDPLLAAAFALYPVALNRAQGKRPSTGGLLGSVAAVVPGVLTLAVTGMAVPATSSEWGNYIPVALTGAASLYTSWLLGSVVRDRRAAAVRATQQAAPSIGSCRSR